MGVLITTSLVCFVLSSYTQYTTSFSMQSVPSSVSSTTSPTSVVDMMKNNLDGFDKQNPRSCILRVGERAGRLCGIANTHLVSKSSSNNVTLVLCMAELLHALMETASCLELNLILSIQKKLALNNRKYPVELCKGKAGKYTQYSHLTGVTKDNQSTESEDIQSPISITELVEALPSLTEEIKEFAEARNWAQYHTPRNLVLAMLGEVGELAELIQWKSDLDTTTASPLSSDELDKLSQELADVSIYLLRLATQCNVVLQLCESLRDMH